MNLASLVKAHPGSARAVYDHGSWSTWAEVRSRASAVAAMLTGAGVRQGDRVAIAWPTSLEFIASYLGVLASGAVAVPLNPNSPEAELTAELRGVGPRVLLAGGAAGAIAAGGTLDVGGLEFLALDDQTSAESVREGTGETFEVAESSESDLAVLLFTSGTAGAARPAMLTHGNLVSNLRQMLAVPEIFDPADVALVAVPLFHVFGLNVALGLALATGASLVLEERFDASESLALVKGAGVTTLLGVPTMFAAWAALPDAGPSSVTGVRRAIAGAAALPAELADRFEQKFGVPLMQGYGLTEASPAVATSLGTGRNRPGSVGRPLPGVELRIVDDSGEEVLDGDPGEILVKGPNVFAGYWNDEKATSEVLMHDGWLRTGDIGVIGEDGDLFVVDRKKDLVIVSGFNVFPAEVERVVGEVPGVSGAVAVGRPDPTTGEAVEVVVSTEPGASVTEGQIREFCALRLARYKCPTSIRFVRELPTGLAGKALRRAVRAQVS